MFVFQDNLTLEEKIRESTNALFQEKVALEEKSTFLHFTQEQLNIQVCSLIFINILSFLNDKLQNNSKLSFWNLNDSVISRSSKFVVSTEGFTSLILVNYSFSTIKFKKFISNHRFNCFWQPVANNKKMNVSFKQNDPKSRLNARNKMTNLIVVSYFCFKVQSLEEEVTRLNEEVEQLRQKLNETEKELVSFSIV